MTYREPTLREALADPLVRTLMRADRVDPAELEAMLTETARHLKRTRGVVRAAEGLRLCA